MLSYCLKCRKNALSKNPKVRRTKNERITLFSKCGVCNSKKSKFIEELSNGLSNLETNIRYKMSETLNKFLLAGDKFMPEINLRQP